MPQMMTSLSTVKTSPKWSFKGKSDYDRIQKTPGPGAYAATTEGYKFNAPSRVVFGTSHRESGRAGASPGPGQYSPDMGNTVRPRSPTFGFGSSRRAGPGGKISTPGPGAYEHKSRMGAEGAKYSVSARRGENRANVTPGPGAYHPSDTNLSQLEGTAKWSFGTSNRESANNRVTPGPGAYEPATKLGRGPSYSMKPRRENRNPGSGPGPGSHGGVITQFGY